VVLWAQCTLHKRSSSKRTCSAAQLLLLATEGCAVRARHFTHIVAKTCCTTTAALVNGVGMATVLIQISVTAAVV
jgi:hypothetical protein